MNTNKKLKPILTIITATFILSGCNGGNSSSPSNLNNLSPALKSQKLNALEAADMDITWTVDKVVKENSLNSSLRDMGWHLLTMTVARIGSSTPPTNVDGILSSVYPKPSPNVGQTVETQDINCQSAVFSKVNDTCSIYFRLTYDTSKGTTNVVKFPVQFTPKGNIPALMTFTAPVNPAISIADYRFTIPAESKYYSAPLVAADKRRYQILTAENGSLYPISITTLQQPTNPLFKIIHRTTSDASDPYYGANAECVTAGNVSLNQINHLDKLLDSCIVIYQAAATSTVPRASNELQIATDASYFFPTWGNKFDLYADYTNANPEQTQTIYGNQMSITSGTAHASGSAMIMDSVGSLEYTAVTKNPVNAVTIDDFIRPAAATGSAAVINQFSGTLYYDPYAGQAPLPVNKPLLVTTNASSLTQTTVTQIGEMTPDNQVYTANIEGGCPIHASVKVNKEEFKRYNQVFTNTYYAGNGIDQSYAGNIGVYNGTTEIVHRDIRSNTWTNSLMGYYTGNGCKSLGMGGGTCFINFPVVWRFYNLGEAQPRKCDQSVTISFPYPDYRNYETLSTPIPQPIAYVGNGGQSYQAGIGSTLSSYTPSYQVNGAPSNGVLVGSYHLTTAPAQQVKFKLNLNSGDVFYNTNLSFARSEGYDLTTFGENTIYQEGVNHE